MKRITKRRNIAKQLAYTEIAITAKYDKLKAPRRKRARNLNFLTIKLVEWNLTNGRMSDSVLMISSIETK